MEKKVKVINDTRLVLVFIDGVLQREVKSYNIVGPAITFNKKIQKGNNVEIIVLYCRDIDPAMTLYDFEAGQYFNEIILTCDAGSANTFGAWKDWYGLSYDYFQVAYQKVGGTKRMLGNVKTYTTNVSNRCTKNGSQLCQQMKSARTFISLSWRSMA